MFVVYIVLVQVPLQGVQGLAEEESDRDAEDGRRRRDEDRHDRLRRW